MHKRTMFLALLLMLSMTMAAQHKVLKNPWTQPVPTASAPTEEVECYLFNVGANGFYTGANDYGTRASFSTYHGYSVTLQKALKADNTWDGKSYNLTNKVEQGGLAGQVGCLKILGYTSIWVDEELTGTDDKYVTFEPQANTGEYRIGVSPLNSTYNESGYYLGLNLQQQNDTRLYFVDTEVNDYTADADLITWLVVTAADYEAYLQKFETFMAAGNLYTAIQYAQATFPSLNIEAETNVFLNTSSTRAQLVEALTSLTDKTKAVADAEHPANLTPLLEVLGNNPYYTRHDNTAWQGTAPAFQACDGAEFYNTNYDTHQTLTEGITPGYYSVSLSAFYRAGWADQDAEEWTKVLNGEPAAQNANLYVTTALGTATAPLPLCNSGATDQTLGDDRLSTTHGNIPNNMWTASAYFAADLYSTPASVACYTDDGTLTLGLRKDTQRDGDWTYLYCWNVLYLGTGTDAAQLLRQQHMQAYPDYVEMQNNGNFDYYTHSVFDDYKAAYTALAAATTAQAINDLIPAFDTQAALMHQNAQAYAAYADKVAQAEAFYIDHQESLMGEGMDLLGIYIFYEEAPSAEFPHPNGSAPYILNAGILTTEQIQAETTYVAKLMDDALASGMSDGMDVTDLIKNPHFAEEGVWTKEGFPEWPVGPDTYKLGQAYTILFNVYQDITGLQDGLYELTLKDLYRPANYGTVEYGNEPKAYVYMNGFEKKLNAIEDGATEGTENGHTYYIDGVGYVPNTVDEAAASFQAGNYGQTLYGLVTDGTMRIGIRSDLRYEGCWAAWSDFHLTFRAKNPEVLAEVIDMTVPNAQELLANQMGVEESLAIDEAITAAQTSEGEARYDAMVSLKEAMDAAQTCIDTYKKLSEVIEGLRQAITDNPDSSHIGEAQTLLNEADEAYNQGTWNNETALQKVEEIGAMAVTLKLGDNTDEEQDVSDLIVNRDFDPTKGSKDTGVIQGWTTTAMNGYKEYTVSYNRSGFHLYQDLVGLPKGHYKVTVHTYYRAGYWNEEEQYIQQGKETHYTTLYAETTGNRAETPVLNLTEGATTEKYHDSKYYTLSNGLFAPDGTPGSAAWFAAGAYLNELEFDVGEDGKARIGLVKEETYPNDYEVVGEWNLYFYPEIREDVTSLIVNPDFNPEPEWGSKDGGWIKGWSTTAMNGYKEHTVSYNRSGFHLYQDLVGLKEGNYEVTVHTYYRAGYWNEEEQYIQQGKETHYTTLYAETTENRAEIPVLNLTEGATTEKYHDSKYYTLSNGLYAPDGTTGTVAWFNAGAYLNTLQFQVPTDGKARIGLIKEETYANDYEVVGAWNLYYLGRATGIDTADIDTATSGTPVAFYTLGGQRLDRPQRGINLVRMSDGTTRKVFLR